MTWLGAATYFELSASLVLFGAALFPFYAKTPTPAWLIRWSGLTASAFGAGAIAFQTLKFGAALGDVLQAGIGRVWLMQIALATLITSLSFWKNSRAVLVVLAAFNLALAGLVGHANAIAGWMGAGVEALHLLAAGGWIGGLVVLFLHLRADPSPELVRRFSAAGIVFVLVIGVTAAALLFLITGTPLPMLAFDYGQFAAVKAVLFAAGLLLAVFNRAYAAPRHAWGLLIKNVVLEGAIVAAVVATAVALAATEPLA